MLDGEDRFDAVEHRFQFDARRVAELGHGGIDGENDDGVDDLDGKIERRLLAFGFSRW